MRFNAERLVDRLADFPELLRAIAGGFAPDEWRARPDESSWSPVEILGHLLREEREDFRVRLRLTLEDPGAVWPGIDPEGDVARQRDIDADPAAVLGAFAAERATSVRWLRGLGAPDWSRAHEHAKFGPIRAGDLLSAWADHDLLHARQLIKRLHQRTVADGGPYSCRYAGEWTA
jgi:hypothetical protein